VALLLARCEQEARAMSHALNEGAGRAAQRDRLPAAEVLRSAGQVAGSPQELHSALANLVNNAVRYTRRRAHRGAVAAPGGRRRALGRG
jgi:two-component system phosphate regulon sensor histidine kinase PhoR